MVQNHKAMLVLGLLTWYVGEAVNPMRKQMISDNVGTHADIDFSDIKQASFVRKQVRADGNIDASDVEAERPIQKPAISWKIGANGEVDFSDPKTSLVRKQMRADGSIDASDAEAERPVRKQSDRTRSNQALTQAPADYDGPFTPPWNDDPSSLTNWTTWCNFELNEGCYACENLGGAALYCRSSCAAAGCPGFAATASTPAPSCAEAGCPTGDNQCLGFIGGRGKEARWRCVSFYTTSMTCESAGYTWCGQAPCVDCTGRIAASVETGVNDQGISKEGKSFCFQRNGELTATATDTVCAQYWAEVVGSTDRYPCAYRSDDHRCIAGGTLGMDKCCSGTAN